MGGIGCRGKNLEQRTVFSQETHFELATASINFSCLGTNNAVVEGIHVLSSCI
jgi:hypothetical protein